MSDCEIYTKQGLPCSFSAKTISPETGKNVCNVHSTICKNNYKKYKDVCGKVWDSKCTVHDNPRSLKKIIKFAQQCKDQRIEYTGKCCNNSWDEGHKGAVIKMSHIIDKCEKSLEKINESDGSEGSDDGGWTSVPKRR